MILGCSIVYSFFSISLSLSRFVTSVKCFKCFALSIELLYTVSESSVWLFTQFNFIEDYDDVERRRMCHVGTSTRYMAEAIKCWKYRQKILRYFRCVVVIVVVGISICYCIRSLMRWYWGWTRPVRTYNIRFGYVVKYRAITQNTYMFRL